MKGKNAYVRVPSKAMGHAIVSSYRGHAMMYVVERRRRWWHRFWNGNKVDR